MANPFYLGIDLDDENAVVSFFQLNMREPETVSTVAGSEMFQIPMLLAKRSDVGQWYIGDDARKIMLLQKDAGAGKLLSRAIGHEKVFVDGEKYPAEDLLVVYLKKLIYLAGSLGNPTAPDVLVISLDSISREVTRLFADIAPRLGLLADQIMLVDRKESFYYFAYNQPRDLMLHDVCLFDCREGKVSCCRLERNMRTTPQVVSLSEQIHSMSGEDRDAAFLQILTECITGHIVSSVYLVGDGFEGNWMKQSVSFLCRGRRAFMGKNLYSKGACYAAAVRRGGMEWPYVYMGDSEMKVNVSLKVRNGDKAEFYTLISAGDNWYETVGECEVILDGPPEIDFWLQLPESREAKVEKLQLVDLPERPNKTTRLRIVAKPLSDKKVQIQIKDMGFGELFKTSEKVWEYVMSC
ncbi:MAG: hypothetical protein J6C37_07150 [Roseburia sp.]|nr:hypothetical protein [Roseburia sp.]